MTAITLDISGMTCAACASRVERALASVEGVAEARVNLALERADVTGMIDEPTLVAAVERAGYNAIARGHTAAERRLARERIEARRRAESRSTFLLFVLAALLSAPFLVEMASMLLVGPGLVHPYAQFALGTAVQFTAGLRFYGGAFKALRAGTANMDVLVALGTSAAWIFSTVMVAIHGEHAHGHLYFEGAAIVITLVLLGKLLETRAKDSATEAVRALFALRPRTARIRTAAGDVDRPVETLALGDHFVVRPGERVPADGVVVEGVSEVDEALVTGESAPVSKRQGALLVEGSLNGSGHLVVETLAIGEDTTLARIARLVENAQTGKAPIQRLVDRVVHVFVPTVIAIAVLTCLGWLLLGGGIENAIIAAVSVLVIACPCALGLATPVTLVAGTGAAAKVGILIRDIEALEQAAHIDTVVFDKTGTLTDGRMHVAAVEPKADRASILRIAATLNGPSEHPLAAAILTAAAAERIEQGKLGDFRAVPGEGVEGLVDSVPAAAGNRALMDRLGIAIEPIRDAARAQAKAGRTPVFVARAGAPVGVIALADKPRATAAAAVAGLKAQGCQVMMLSGDTEAAAENLARALGLDGVEAPVRPAEKAHRIAKLREEGRHVAMVGDGINDAPALAAADLGMAMGSGTDAAMAAAGVTLMRPDPALVPAALVIAGATARKIRQNLFFAFIYNVIGIPLAAFGLLSPAVAGTAMAASSVSVVLNALDLRRWRP
ncbi:MAG: heavy metal translocating P-type ATPase [Labrys sp. (in: a-proteobacteria)]